MVSCVISPFLFGAPVSLQPISWSSFLHLWRPTHPSSPLIAAALPCSGLSHESPGLKPFPIHSPDETFLQVLHLQNKIKFPEIKISTSNIEKEFGGKDMEEAKLTSRDTPQTFDFKARVLIPLGFPIVLRAKKMGPTKSRKLPVEPLPGGRGYLQIPSAK